MRLCLVTGEAPRHAAAATALRDAGHDVTILIDEAVATLRDQTAMSPVRRRYVKRVAGAERALYGSAVPSAGPDRTFRTDLASIDRDGRGEGAAGALGAFARSEGIVLYGCSYFRGRLLERLRAGFALSVHMGIAPFYRGSSANFWAAYDGHPTLIGTTVHFLVAEPDAGPILFYSRPAMDGNGPVEYFTHAMAAVRVAFTDIGRVLRHKASRDLEPIRAENSPVLRETAPEAFTDEIIGQFLSRQAPLVRAEFGDLYLPGADDCLQRTRVLSETQRVTS